MFRVDLTSVVEHILKTNYDLKTSQSKIDGKLFLFAQTLWLKSHKSKLNSIKTVFESSNNQFSISKRKAYTITKIPKYITLNLEYGDYFNYTEAGTESGENDFKRHICHILPKKFDLNQCVDVLTEEEDELSRTHHLGTTGRSNSVGSRKCIVYLHR